MALSDQPQAPAALHQGKEPLVSRADLDMVAKTRNSSTAPAGNRTPVVQSLIELSQLIDGESEVHFLSVATTWNSDGSHLQWHWSMQQCKEMFPPLVLILYVGPTFRKN
jgi:hypothetical protein